MINRSDILDEAKKAICTDRQNDYGEPEDNFQKISSLWSVYLGRPILKKDVAVMMILLKVARVASGHGKGDNWVDICGYSAIGGEIEDNNASIKPY